MSQELPSGFEKIEGYGPTIEISVNMLQWNIKGNYRLDWLPGVTIQKSKIIKRNRFYIRSGEKYLALNFHKTKEENKEDEYYLASIDTTDILTTGDIKKEE